MQVTGLSDYVTTSKVAYSNINRIPTIKMEENKYLKYRPAANNFRAEEEKVVQNFGTREKLIKDLDTGMSPFMKNQNDHMQRMRKSIARQEAIANQY